MNKIVYNLSLVMMIYNFLTPAFAFQGQYNPGDALKITSPPNLTMTNDKNSI